jgi:hypothetical protein
MIKQDDLEIMVLSQHLTEETEQNQNSLSQNSQCSGKHSKQKHFYVHHYHDKIPLLERGTKVHIAKRC